MVRRRWPRTQLANRALPLTLTLEKKVQTKDEVLAELMAETVALEKTLGEL